MVISTHEAGQALGDIAPLLDAQKWPRKSYSVEVACLVINEFVLKKKSKRAAASKSKMQQEQVLEEKLDNSAQPTNAIGHCGTSHHDEMSEAPNISSAQQNVVWAQAQVETHPDAIQNETASVTQMFRSSDISGDAAQADAAEVGVKEVEPDAIQQKSAPELTLAEKYEQVLAELEAEREQKAFLLREAEVLRQDRDEKAKRCIELEAENAALKAMDEKILTAPHLINKSVVPAANLHG